MSEDRLAGAPPEVVEAFNQLPAKRRAFALALPMAKSQEKAALQAGYAPKTAQSQAFALAADPRVKIVSEYLMGTAIERSVLTIERCFEELAKLVGADPKALFDDQGALLPPDQWPEGSGAAIAEVHQSDIYEGVGDEREKVGVANKLKFVDKTSALNLAFKLLDAFPEKKKQVTHTHRVGVVVVPAKGAHQHDQAAAIEGQAQRITQPPKKGNAPDFMVRKVRSKAIEAE